MSLVIVGQEMADTVSTHTFPQDGKRKFCQGFAISEDFVCCGS